MSAAALLDDPAFRRFSAHARLALLVLIGTTDDAPIRVLGLAARERRALRRWTGLSRAELRAALHALARGPLPVWNESTVADVRRALGIESDA